MLIAVIGAILSLPFDILYWIKWIIAYIAIRTHVATQTRRLDLYDPTAKREPEKLGFLIPQLETDLESPFPDTHLQEAADEIMFYGVNSKSEALLVRITRGCNQVAEAWIYVKLANGKAYHLTEILNYQQPYEGKCPIFSSGNLQMHFLKPMRKWRIFFCGLLKERDVDSDASEATVFVKFVFIWTASTNVFDFSHINNPNSFAKALARSDWPNPFYPPYLKILEAMNNYTQVGTIMGTLSVDEGPDYEMYLFGEKNRNIGKSSILVGCQFSTLVGYVPENGFAIHLIKGSVPYAFNNLSSGFIVHCDGSMSTVTDANIAIKPYNISNTTRDFKATAMADTLYTVTGRISRKPAILYSGQGWNGSLELSFLQFDVMNKKGWGLVFTGEIYLEERKLPTPTLKLMYPKNVPFVVKFTDEISQFGEISGGKGSSLGKLMKLSSRDKTFTVPKGIIVTTAAYDEFLTPEILQQVKKLESIAYGKLKGDLKMSCELLSENIANATLQNKIRQSIIENLRTVFGEKFTDYKFAVRSSATGEDTDVMSAAGQMDTFLGVQNIEKIFIAVKKCWASQFGHIAVEYKRQNGQLLNSPMAVVIQEMVASEVSGVLFTCDPVTNNPSVITITANYGLGETVVSGSVEPDTIVLQRLENDQLKVKSVNIGSKHQKIIMQDSGGTITEDLPEDSKTESCLSLETAEKLGKLALRVEKFYRSSRDIEWGIQNEQIYLLQSRPVTSGAAVTDFEVKHEFDAPLRSEKDYLSVANVGEVMPGATSPLGADIITKYFAGSFAELMVKSGDSSFAKSVYFNYFLPTFYYHGMVPVIELANRYGTDSLLSKGFTISIFGRLLEEVELQEMAKERIKPPKSSILKELGFLLMLFTHDWNVEKVKKKVDTYPLTYLNCISAEEIFTALMNSCSDFNQSFVQHIMCTECSSHWNIMLFLILFKIKGNFDTDVYSDFARLLATSSNLESADIPSSMQDVALQIVKDLGKEKFISMSLEEAENWLTLSKTSAAEKFHQFISRHGHRCLKEFDVHSVPWGQNKKNLISLLQTLAGSVQEIAAKEDESISKIFSELRVPLNFLNRLLLRFVIPNCRRAVRSREACKSVLIKSIHQWRKGYQYLAKLMVEEGRIPDSELLFFMTLDEIRELLKTRHPKIIARANARKKLFPVLETYRFPEIMQGVPKPINENDEDSTDAYEYVSDLTMQGIPVSRGVTKGYCRVAVSLEQAALLKPGEILIAYSTDIGWSPYFPIISGIVTELGGLISHGAVVSREYGLPCVVGLQGATKKFKTGDYVMLDGKKGILQRLPHPLKE